MPRGMNGIGRNLNPESDVLASLRATDRDSNPASGFSRAPDPSLTLRVSRLEKA